METPMDKPTLVYTIDELTGLEEIPSYLGGRYLPAYAHGSTYSPLYKHKDAKGGDLIENCHNFARWEDMEDLKGSRLTVVMPSNMWCPSTATAHFDVHISALKQAGTLNGKMIWHIIWSKTPTGSIHTVPEWVMDF